MRHKNSATTIILNTKRLTIEIKYTPIRFKNVVAGKLIFKHSSHSLGKFLIYTKLSFLLGLKKRANLKQALWLPCNMLLSGAARATRTPFSALLLAPYIPFHQRPLHSRHTEKAEDQTPLLLVLVITIRREEALS
jgi:hypothetical protein